MCTQIPMRFMWTSILGEFSYIIGPIRVYVQDCQVSKKTLSKARSRITDPHRFHADPDFSFHFNADPDQNFYLNADPDTDPAPHQSDANLRLLITNPPQRLYASFVRVHGLPWLNFKLLKLLNFYFNADPDPVLSCGSGFPNNADPCGSGSAILARTRWYDWKFTKLLEVPYYLFGAAVILKELPNVLFFFL